MIDTTTIISMAVKAARHGQATGGTRVARGLDRIEERRAQLKDGGFGQEIGHGRSRWIEPRALDRARDAVEDRLVTHRGRHSS